MPLNRSLVRFGVFELNVEAHELRKRGVRIKLQDQPFQILTILLEHPGDVVTRDELRSRLWSDGTFVDFDHGLNASVNKLRETLGDSASNPRFVETVTRQGYRFIAPVEFSEPANKPKPVADRPRKSSYIAKFVVAATAAVLIVAMVALARRWSRSEPAVDQSSR
jgi:DNA-binding winged helix-turn-helix (wHTH) protein